MAALNFIALPGYKFFRKDRPVEDGGGGCVLYYAESLDLVLIQNCFPANLDTLEAIWAELKFHSQNLALSIMYRPPKDTNFFGILERQLDCICKKRKTSSLWVTLIQMCYITLDMRQSLM